MKIEGKVALVTGGASGIGKALVQRLLESNVKFVSIVDCDERDAEKAIAEFSGTFESDHVRYIRCDVTDQQQLRNAFEETYNVHKALDIVVNNAGIISRDHVRVMTVNAIGVMNGMLLANEIMTKTKRAETGVIINTSSVAGFAAYNHVTLGYIASKHAITGLTKGFQCSCDGFSKDLRCVTVCPGTVDTPISTRNNFITEEEQRMHMATEKQKDSYTPMDKVIDGYVKAIEDDSLSGVFVMVENQGLRVTEG